MGHRLKRPVLRGETRRPVKGIEAEGMREYRNVHGDLSKGTRPTKVYQRVDENGGREEGEIAGALSLIYPLESLCLLRSSITDWVVSKKLFGILAFSL